ncbi:MAG: gliding motility-associated C-terminal domain-containing protein [Flavobacteriales bacterium]|nr:gliding motility-associated C-terminal domain-containing protein [Flavobacteriales bacterium]
MIQQTIHNLILLIFLMFSGICLAQNSLVGDGFGGRKWYVPTNYTVGSYSAYSICYENCDSQLNQLYGWGSNIYNSIGIGLTTTGVNVPTLIPNIYDIKYISAGYLVSVIKHDNTAWAWGTSGNYSGFGGNPIQVMSNVSFLDAGSNTLCYVKNDGTVWSIGANSAGHFGDGNVNYLFNSIPVQMLNINNAARVAVNFLSTIILLKDSSVWSVGDNYGGNLGLGSNITQTLIPMQVAGIPKIIDIKSNAEATIALTVNGNVYTWGIDYNSGYYNYSPTLIQNLSNIIAISGCDDGNHFLALDENKNCYGWGKNNYNSSFGSPNPSYTPSLVATDVIDIMAGETFSYIVKSDGSLWATGFTNLGSVWLNLPSNLETDTFTLIDPSLAPEACKIVGGGLPCFDELINDSIYFPNVFTPNGDGFNDHFYFPNEGINELNCQIFNRWGTKVYEWDNINGFWDGKTAAGNDCPDGVYYYIVNYKRIASMDTEQHTGYITLIR